MEDDDTGHRVLLTVLRVAFLSVSRAVPQCGLGKHIQVSVTLGVHGGLKDRIGQCDGRLLIHGAGASEGLVPRELRSGKIHFLQTVHGDDWR